MTREEVEKIMGDEPKIQASFEVIGDDVKFIKLIVNGKENIVSVEELENTLSEPCDCISREEVCDYIAEFVNHEYATDREREMVKNIIGGIQHLPSIQPKTGHWVSKHIVDDCNGVVTWYECSECGRSVDETVTEKFMLKDYPYCHCGARMLPTDSEKE